MKKFANTLIVLAMVLVGYTVQANDEAAKNNDKTVWQKTKDGASEVKDDTVDGTKKAYRKVKDKTCEMINGKLECAAKKVGHAAQNTMDKAGDKVDDVKKKAQ